MFVSMDSDRHVIAHSGISRMVIVTHDVGDFYSVATIENGAFCVTRNVHSDVRHRNFCTLRIGDVVAAPNSMNRYSIVVSGSTTLNPTYQFEYRSKIVERFVVAFEDDGPDAYVNSTTDEAPPGSEQLRLGRHVLEKLHARRSLCCQW